jgi:hypothetical protein
MVLGFETEDIEALARRLREALGIALFRSDSPMIGPWYSDVDLSDIVARIRSGQAIENSAERFILRLNDPDPYRPPEWPGPIGCLLVVGSSVDAADVRSQLAGAGLTHAVLRENE